jgi:hypothetical protein
MFPSSTQERRVRRFTTLKKINQSQLANHRQQRSLLPSQ